MNKSQQKLLASLNNSWTIAGPAPLQGSLLKRALFQLRSIAARLLRPQETFNSTTVQYLNSVNASLEALESAIASAEQRLLGSQEDLRVASGAAHRSVHALKREVEERLAGGEHASVRRSGPSGPRSDGESPRYDASKYVGFEDQFRGTSEEIRRRQTAYLPIFQGASDVLDIGCGRGEFLALLQEHGVPARGIDVNDAMVATCREHGLAASVADALSYLREQPDESLGGIFAAQVIEHLSPAYLIALIESAFTKLRPGAPIVLETINPASWVAFFDSYIRDFTHSQPIHADTLKFLLVATGFQQLEIRYQAPYPESEKLRRVSGLAATTTSSGVGELASILDSNSEKLNRLLFGDLDYAAVARRP